MSSLVRPSPWIIREVPLPLNVPTQDGNGELLFIILPSSLAPFMIFTETFFIIILPFIMLNWWFNIPGAADSSTAPPPTASHPPTYRLRGTMLILFNLPFQSCRLDIVLVILLDNQLSYVCVVLFIRIFIAVTRTRAQLPRRKLQLVSTGLLRGWKRGWGNPTVHYLSTTKQSKPCIFAKIDNSTNEMIWIYLAFRAVL